MSQPITFPELATFEVGINSKDSIYAEDLISPYLYVEEIFPGSNGIAQNAYATWKMENVAFVSGFTLVNHLGFYQTTGSAGGTRGTSWNYRGYLSGLANVGNIDFTGQHRSMPSSSTSLVELSGNVGKIVVADGEYSNLGGSEISINEALPRVKLSSAQNEKTVYGVISDSEDTGSNQREYSAGAFVSVFEKKDGDDHRLIINSIGEGAIWVSNINGNLENGDYITTCEIPGYGMLQNDDLLHNYTVAKITMDCDFDLNSDKYECVEIQHNGQTYKAAFVGCTYHCG